MELLKWDDSCPWPEVSLTVSIRKIMKSINVFMLQTLAVDEQRFQDLRQKIKAVQVL